MNTITDEMISLEEARFALNNIVKNSFTVEESLETLDSYIERVRLVNMAWLVNYIIDTRLSEIQKYVVKSILFEMNSADECAQRLGVSLRAVYSAKKKALEIIGSYLEPVLMYFQNLTEIKDVSLFTLSAINTLSAQKNIGKRNENVLLNIRLSHGADLSLTSKLTGLSEKEILQLENGNKEITLNALKRYSKGFNLKITYSSDLENGGLEWKKL